jgi:hypothetical protein
MLNLPRQIVAIVALVALIVAGFLIWQTISARQRAAQARQDTKGAEAYADAAKGAVAVVVANGEGQAKLTTVVTEAARDIAAAEGSNTAIPPAAQAAALAAACRLPAYAKEPRCIALK